MEANEQAAGEKQVRERLIKPLLKLGLARPGGMTIATFDDMCSDLCQRLAYMDELSLDALCESAANMASGANKDRFPIAKKVLDEAGEIQAPKSNESPLLRKFFRHPHGLDAMEVGYGPEIRQWILKHRRWPGDYTRRQAELAGADNRMRQRRIEEKLTAGEAVPEEDMAWRALRVERLRKCEALASKGADT